MSDSTEMQKACQNDESSVQEGDKTDNQSETIAEAQTDPISVQASNSTTAITTQTTPTNVTTTATQPPGPPPQLGVEQQLLKAKRDLESMVLKYAKSEQENLKNKNKVDDLDKKLKRAIRDNDQLANRIKILTNDKTSLTNTLNAKVAQLTVVEQKKTQLNSVQSVKLKDLETRIKDLETDNEDLLKQIESYKSKEGELLDFSERLSMKHMLLQTELDEALKREPSFKGEYETILEQNSRLEEENTELTRRLKSLSASLESKEKALVEMKNERQESELKYRNEFDRLENEIKVMRRKHQIATKELLKEMKHLQAQLEKATTPGATPASVVTASG